MSPGRKVARGWVVLIVAGLAPLPAPAGEPEQLAWTKRSLREVRAELGPLRDKLDALKEREKKAAEPSVSEEAVREALARDKQTLGLEAEADRIQNLIQRTLERSRHGEKDPDVRRLRFDLATVNAQIVKRQRDVRATLLKELREQARAEVPSIRARVAFLTKLEGLLLAEQRRLEKKAPAAPEERDKRLERLEQEVGELKDSVRELTKELRRKR